MNRGGISLRPRRWRYPLLVLNRMLLPDTVGTGVDSYSFPNRDLFPCRFRLGCLSPATGVPARYAGIDGALRASRGPLRRLGASLSRVNYHSTRLARGEKVKKYFYVPF